MDKYKEALKYFNSYAIQSFSINECLDDLYYTRNNTYTLERFCIIQKRIEFLENVIDKTQTLEEYLNKLK